ncbi:MAG TPA: hypothetical protein ENJ54_09935 [Chloroflexi bacterium]|nr:hypothetical protein [Chloroflexota bacterium]
MVALPLTQVSPFRFLTPEEAAAQTGLSAAELLKRAEAGKILSGMFDQTLRIAVTQDGQVVEIAPTPQDDHGDDINARLRQIRREDFAHLEGQAITVSEAARKYGVQRHTILAWVRRYTHVIKVMERGYRLLLEEAGVAYLAALHKTRKDFGIKSGSPLVDEYGQPNLIKHPSLSAYRRQH